MKKNTLQKLVFLPVIIIILFSINCLLLLNSDKEILAEEPPQELEEKCLIDAEVANGFEMGKIPIGETVDYAELYAREIIRNLNILIVNTEKAANTAYNKKSEDDLYDIPPQIKCEKCEAVNLTKKVCTINPDTGEKECECVDCGCRCLECGCCPDCGEKCPSSKCVIAGCNAKDTNKGKITSGKCNSKCFCNGALCTSGSCTCIVNCSGSAGATDSCGCGLSQDFYHCPYTCTCSSVKPFCGG